MATFVPIPLYLQIAEISQYLSQADISSGNALNGGNLNNNYTRLLRAVRKAVKWAYNRNPNDLTTEPTAIYMYQLCGKYASQAQIILNGLAASPPVLTGPVNESTTVGGSVTFSVSASGTAPFTYQWMLNGAPITGATGPSYVITNAQLSQSGNLYSVAVTNSVTTVTSNPATLTVTATLSASYYFGTTDYSSQLLASSDVVPYAGTFPITSGQPLSFTWSSGAANNQYIVVRYPSTESVKTTYSNAPLNNGLIPSIAFNAIVTFGGFNYIFSRSGNPFSQNTSAPLIFS